MASRKYYRKLLKIFVASGAVFVVAVAAVSGGFVMKQQRLQYESAVRETAYTSASMAKISLSVILTALKDLAQSREIDRWAVSGRGSEYYYASVGAFEQIGKVSAGVTAVNFDISVTTLDEDSFFISKNGTVSKKLFFQRETRLSPEQVALILDHFRTSDIPLLLPVYSEGALDELYYVIKRTSSNGYTDVLYLARIPRATLFGAGADRGFVLMDAGAPEQALAFSREQDAARYDEALYEKILAPSAGTMLKYRGMKIFVDDITGLNWRIAFLYDEIGNGWQKPVAILLGISVLLLGAITAASIGIAKKLYAPVDNAVASMTAGGYLFGGGEIDEFQIIRNSAARMKTLSEELKDLMNEKSALMNRELYHNLLYGGQIAGDYADRCRETNYCVAVIEFVEDEDGAADNGCFLSKNLVDAYTRETQGLYYAGTGYNQCAVVMEGAAAEAPLDTLKALIRALPETVGEFKAAVSGTEKGPDQICRCFRQAMQLLEYKYACEKRAILTPEIVSGHGDTTYFYPLATEVRLIRCVAEGKEEAETLFRELLTENIENRTLSPAALQSFVHELIGTINRAFQEMKTTPEALLGRSVNFSELYTGWDKAKTVSQVSAMLHEIVGAARRNSSSSDDKLMHDMLTYIHENYQNDIMLNDMAERFNISPKYCSVLFKRICGDTFKNSLNQYRVETACRFIEENPSVKISDLSARVGFNSSNSFIRVFSKYTGITPRVYADRFASEKASGSGAAPR